MKRRPWIAVFIWIAFILVLTSMPSTPELPGIGDNSDKLGHFGVYLVLGLLLRRAWSRQHRYWGRRDISAVAFITGLAFGAFDELHQLFIPGRWCSVWDLAADAVGLAAGIIVGGFAKISDL